MLLFFFFFLLSFQRPEELYHSSDSPIIMTSGSLNRTASLATLAIVYVYVGEI